jgi:predicted enzyme related to lactoylglutathione lyase
VTSVPDFQVLFAGVSVSDLGAAVGWYSRLFGRSPDIEVNTNEVMWHLTEAGWLYVIVNRQRAGGGLVTLSVPDLDQAVGDIAGRGVTIGAIEPVGAAGRKASVSDPDGNLLSFVQIHDTA